MSREQLVAGIVGALAVVGGGFAAWMGFALLRFRGYYLHKGERPPPMTFGELARYLLYEVYAMLTLGWWHLRAARRNGLLLPEGPESGPPVLCVHGITQDGTNLWGIRQVLRRRGRASMAVSLGRYGRSLHAHVPPLVEGLRELVRRTADGRVDIVAHSMGGVVLRLALATHPELQAHVRRVVTLGSPHAGTAAGRGFPLSTIRSLGRRSELLRSLPGFPPGAEVTTIAARHDLLVYPCATCHLQGARTIELPDVGHTGLLTWPAVQALVVEALCEDAPREARG